MNFSETPITFIIIAANVLFSIVGFSNNAMLEKTIGWPYYTKKNNEYYRFITSGFLHADWMHLFFNMFTLFFFGRNIEILFAAYGLGGNLSYLLLYFLGMIVADLPSYFKHQDNYNYRTLGASGAVSAVLFASIVFDPWAALYLYGAFKISAVAFAVLYLAYTFYMSKKGTNNVNHDAHLWGSIFGVVFTLALIAFLQPVLFDSIFDELQKPSLFGRP
jgi:membrane associated rhomboid family serine protease